MSHTKLLLTMGFAKCRVAGCPETGSQEYVLSTDDLSKKGVYLWIPSMWWHYAVLHGFWPKAKARELVMKIMPDDPSLTGQLMQMRSAVPASALSKVEVLKVEVAEVADVADVAEFADVVYDHEKGQIDWDFVKHLEKLLAKLHPAAQKTVHETGTYR